MTSGTFYRNICCLLILICFSLSVTGQQRDNHCGTSERTVALLQKDTLLPGKMAVLEQMVKQYVVQHPIQAQRGIITIPVVVHVINNGEPVGSGSNISDEQVFSEIDVLNKDYRRLNADTFKTPGVFKPLAADFGIQFQMAVRDPNGRPTNGIDRVNEHKQSWSPTDIDNIIKPKTIWDYQVYLNIWTVNFASTYYILGYTIIPLITTASIDGVVIGYSYYGNTGNVKAPYNLGRTATHEIGHWLGLYHPWGKTNGADVYSCGDTGAYIADVPAEAYANFGCPSFPHITCTDGPNGDMFMNYMDYTNDDCMNMFTNGQKASAYSILNTLRDSILTSTASTRYAYDAAILSVRLPDTRVCSDSFKPLLQISNEGATTLTSCYINYNIDGNTNGQVSWSGKLATGQSTFVTLPVLEISNGSHSIDFYVSSPNNKPDQFNTNDGITVNFTVDTNSVSTQSLPLTEGFEDGTIPALWTVTTSNSPDSIEWQVTTNAGAESSSNSVWVNNFAGSKNNNSRGTRADFILQPLSIDTGKFPYLTFDVAYAQKDSSSSDSLLVAYSLDCGGMWYNVYAKGGATLKTAAPVSVSYTPAAGDWRQEGVDIFEVAGQANLLIRFEVYSGWGNNIYVDNINMGEYFTGINEIPKLLLSVVISPNPSNGKFTATFNQPLPEHSALEVVDLLGRSIYFNPNISGINQVIDLSENGAGVYIAKVVSGNSSIVKKLVIQ